MNFKRANQLVVVTLSNPAGDELHLRYQLYDHSLREKWVKLMLTDREKRQIEEDGYFFGKRFHDEKDLENKINDCIQVINHYAEKFNSSKLHIPLQAKIPMTNEFLNNAHRYYEKIAPIKTIRLIHELRRAVENFNMTIHQAEAFTPLGEFPTEHLEVLFRPRGTDFLSDEDFKLFTTRNRFGELYLSYGTTGVPTKNAYILGAEPVPQKVYCTGMMLSFMEDSEFQIDDNFRTWLSQRKMSADDPKSAIGLIPLGVLIEPEIEDREEFFNRVNSYRKVIKVHFERL